MPRRREPSIARMGWQDWYREFRLQAHQAGVRPEEYAGPTGEGDEYVASLYRDGVTPQDAVQWVKDRQERRGRQRARPVGTREAGARGTYEVSIIYEGRIDYVVKASSEGEAEDTAVDLFRNFRGDPSAQQGDEYEVIENIVTRQVPSRPESARVSRRAPVVSRPVRRR